MIRLLSRIDPERVGSVSELFSCQFAVFGERKSMPTKKRSIPFYGTFIAGVFSIVPAVFLASLVLCPFVGRATTVGVSFSGPVNFPVGAGPSSLAVADFNGDGTLDLIVPSILGSNISVLLGNGNGTFQPAITYPVRFHPIRAPSPRGTSTGIASSI